MKDWRSIPWIVAVFLSPLLFGSVVGEAQGFVGVLLVAGCLLCWPRWNEVPGLGKELAAGVVVWVALAFFYVFPLPEFLVSDSRLEWRRSFPAGSEDWHVWIPGSLAPGKSMPRLWEGAASLLIYALGAALAGGGRRPRGFVVVLAISLGIQVVLAWYKWIAGVETVWGVWMIPWGVGAGSFPNRNFFAIWCCAAAFVLAGCMAQQWRDEKERGKGKLPMQKTPLLLCLATLVLVGLLSSVASGSRGAFLAGAGGAAVGGMLLCRIRSERAGGLWWLGSVGVAALVLCLAGAPLLNRVAARDQNYAKWAIWSEAVRLWKEFPMAGSGLGTFEVAVNPGKSSLGELSLRHVENDYLQLLAETGLFGFLVMSCWAGWILLGILPRLRNGSVPKPEWVAGCAAGLTAIALHSCVDFPAQIPAVLFLAAALAGVLRGMLSNVPAEANADNSGWTGSVAFSFLALAASLGAAAHLASFGFWQKALREPDPVRRLASIDASLRFWPWNSKRVMGAARTAADLVRSERPEKRSVLWAIHRIRLLRSLAWNRLDWPLRLELLTFDMEFRPRDVDLRSDARVLIASNPLNPRLYLETARILGTGDARGALEILKRAPKPVPLQRDILDLGWKLAEGSDVLWELVSPSSDGLKVLAEFALDHGLPGLAVEAIGQMAPAYGDWAWKCEIYSKAGRPDLVIAEAPEKGGLGADYWRSRGLFELGKTVEAWKVIDAAITEIRRGKAWAQLSSEGGGSGSGVDAMREWSHDRSDRAKGRAAAKELAVRLKVADSERGLDELAAAFPRDLSILHLRYAFYLARNETGKAVRAGHRLMEVWLEDNRAGTNQAGP